MVNVRFAPGGLFAPEKVIMVVAHWPTARLPRFCGSGLPFVMGELNVAFVSRTLLAEAPPAFCTVTPAMTSPQLLRTSGVIVTTNLAGDGDGDGLGDGDGDGDGFGDGEGDGLGDGDGVGDGDGDGATGCNSKAPTSAPSLAFEMEASSKVRVKPVPRWSLTNGPPIPAAVPLSIAGLSG